MSNPEAELRAMWTAKGVPLARQDSMIAEIVAKAQPAYLARLFPSELTDLGEQFLIPGCEKRPTPGTKGAKATEPDLWDAASNAGRT